MKYHFAHRLTILYLNYWLIWLLFVPVGILFFDRTFSKVYHDHVLIKSIIDFFGLSRSFGFNGYNATWWFYSCIIILYFLYPLIHKTIKYWHVWFLVGISFTYGLRVLSNHIGMLSHFWNFIGPIKFYLGVFIWGILLSHFNVISWFKEHLTVPVRVATIGTFVYVSYFRLKAGWAGMTIDPYLVVLLVFAYVSIDGMDKVKSIFAFLGKHSFNIFLFHTFIFSLYFHDLVYYTENPIIQFFSLLIPCLVISILIEKMKDTIHLNAISKSIENAICR